jgi:6-phosphogluconolactonase
VAEEPTERPRLLVSRDPVAAAADALCEAIRCVLATRESVRLAIPGGSALAALPGARDRLGPTYTRVALTWIDERCVPAEDAASNFGAALRLGVLERPAPAQVLRLYHDRESPERAVERVSAALRSEFDDALDVLLLGLGEDGHIASLFPTRSGTTGEHARVAHVADSPKPPRDRITLSRSMLATARRAILLATGEGKRAALARLLGGDASLPAHGLPGLVVVTDLALPERKEADDA